MADSPFIRDVPAARALDAWRAARDAAGCPARLPAIRVPAGTTRRAWSPPSRCGPPGPHRRSTRPAWTASRSAPPTPLGASETTPVLLQPGAYDVVDTGDPMPDGRDAVVMREHVHYVGRRRRTARGRAALPACAVDRRGREHGRAAAARGAPAARRGPGRRRGRGRDRTCWCGAARWWPSCPPGTRSGRSARQPAPARSPTPTR